MAAGVAWGGREPLKMSWTGRNEARHHVIKNMEDRNTYMSVFPHLPVGAVMFMISATKPAGIFQDARVWLNFLMLLCTTTPAQTNRHPAQVRYFNTLRAAQQKL